jgi:DNA-binding NarL/FixJ family response regulator
MMAVLLDGRRGPRRATGGGSGTSLRVLLAVSQPLLAVGLRDAVERDRRLAVVAAVAAPAALRREFARLRPDLVVADEALAVAALAGRAAAGGGCVVVLVRDPAAAARGAIDLGADGVLSTSVETRDAAAALLQVVRGTMVTPVRGAGGVRLTRREADVVRAIASGCSNRDVALELGVGVGTVKAHLGSAFRKLGVANRTQAARWAVVHGLCDDANAVAVRRPARRPPVRPPGAPPPSGS